MKIIVFGATGGVGRHIISQAVDSGHQVTALVRDPARLDLPRVNLEFIRGDVLDYTSVEAAVRDHDAVLSALGTPALTHNTVRSEGTRNIVRAMESTGVPRLISLSTIGVGDSEQMLPLRYRYVLVPLLLRKGFADHALQESYIRQSRTLWTIVRPGEYTNDSRNGSYRHGTVPPRKRVKAKIPRAAVAEFMLKQLSSTTYLNQAPWVSQ